MTDDTSTPTPEPSTPSGPGTGDAWNEVVARMNDLADAVSAWAKAAANEPDTKQKLDQMRGGINNIARKADAVADRVASSDPGRQFMDGAEQAGQALSDAAQQVSQSAAPHMRNAFAGISDVFGKAAARVDEATRRREQHASAPGESEKTPDAAPAAPAIPASPPASPPADENDPATGPE